MADRLEREQRRDTRSRCKSRPVPTTSCPVDLTQVIEWKDGAVARVDDYLVGEEPLEICIGALSISVAMHTPGHDGHKRNVVRLDLRRGVAFDAARLQRHLAATSSCGLCGKASIDAVRVRSIARPNPDLRIAPDVLSST